MKYYPVMWVFFINHYDRIPIKQPVWKVRPGFLRLIFSFGGNAKLWGNPEESLGRPQVIDSITVYLYL